MLKLTPKQFFKKAYRLARCPDSFLADNLILDFPVHYLVYALKCANFQLGQSSFKQYVRSEVNND